MTTFNVPVTVKIEADSAEEAAAKVLSFMAYAQDVGNDDDAVKGSLVATAAEVTKD